MQDFPKEKNETTSKCNGTNKFETILRSHQIGKDSCNLKQSVTKYEHVLPKTFMAWEHTFEKNIISQLIVPVNVEVDSILKNKTSIQFHCNLPIIEKFNVMTTN